MAESLETKLRGASIHKVNQLITHIVVNRLIDTPGSYGG